MNERCRAGIATLLRRNCHPQLADAGNDNGRARMIIHPPVCVTMGGGECRLALWFE